MHTDGVPEGRKDSLKLEFEEHLKEEKKKIRRKARGQPPLALQQPASGAKTLEEVDRAISEDNNQTPKQHVQ